MGLSGRLHRAARLACTALVVAGPAGAQPAAPITADTVTTVDAVAVQGAPLPNVGPGAPLFTPAEIHEKGYNARATRETFEDGRARIYECYLQTFGTPPYSVRMIGLDEGADAARRVSTWSRNAEEATELVQRLRMDVPAGKATQVELERAEFERQRAVNTMIEAEREFNEAILQAVDIQELVADRTPPAAWRSEVNANVSERATRKYAIIPKEFEDLKLENIVAAERLDDKGEPYLLVSGAIRNTRARRISIPPLSVSAVDRAGKVLKQESGTARGSINPGEAKPFTFSLRPSPALTARVTVTFGERTRPAFLNSADIDPICQYAASGPYQVKGAPTNEQCPMNVPDDIAMLDPRTAGAGGPALPPPGRVSPTYTSCGGGSFGAGGGGGGG